MRWVQVVLWGAVAIADPSASTASPPAGWAPDAAGWAQPLEAARRLLDGSEGEDDALGPARRWLRLVPDRAMTRRAKWALELEVAARSRSPDRARRLQVQTEGCLEPDEAPWATHAVRTISHTTESATQAWAILGTVAFVPDAIDALRERSLPASVDRALRQRLLVEAPDHPLAREIADEIDLRGLAAVVPSLEARVARTEALLEAHRNAEARIEAVTWLQSSQPSPEQSCRLVYVAGKAARKERSYGESLRHLEAARDACARADATHLRMRAILLQAQVHRILSQPEEIRRLFDEAAGVAPRHSFLDDLLFLEADAHDGAGRERLASQRYRALVDRFPRGDMAPQAAWRVAHGLLDRSPETAREWLERAERAAPPGSRDHERALYWGARLDEPVAPDRARSVYAELFRELSYYGLLARERLLAVAPAQAQQVGSALSARVSPPPPVAPPRPELAAAADTVARLFDPDWARALLEEAACDAEAGRRFELAEALVARGEHAAAQRVVRPVQDAFLGPFGAPSVADWRVAYSLPYPEAVRAAARAARIDPWLLWGLAREESTFDAEIVSWAGAIGLTQLMPPTAYGAHAAVFRRPLPDVEALLDPELNLRLGAHVLAEGFQRWRLAPLAITAYNAGSGLTARFLARSSGDLDRYVEAISVPQTRGYVQRVLESWARYRLLYGEDDERFLDLPDRVPWRPRRAERY